MNSIKGVLLKAETMTIAPVTITTVGSVYQGIRDALGDCLIEDREYHFGTDAKAPVFDILCDEEGAYTGKKVSAMCLKGNEWHTCALGDLFICKTNEDGEWVSLTDEECKTVMDCARVYDNPDTGEKFVFFHVFFDFEAHDRWVEQMKADGWAVF